MVMIAGSNQDDLKRTSTNSFLVLNGAPIGGIQTGSIGRDQGVYELKGEWKLVQGQSSTQAFLNTAGLAVTNIFIKGFLISTTVDGI